MRVRASGQRPWRTLGRVRVRVRVGVRARVRLRLRVSGQRVSGVVDLGADAELQRPWLELLLVGVAQGGQGEG